MPVGRRGSGKALAVPRALAGRAHRRQLDALDDAVADGPDALHGHLHDVAGPQRRGGGPSAGASPPPPPPPRAGGGGGPPAPGVPHSSARQPPLPQVPEPSTSPARTSVPRE